MNNHTKDMTTGSPWKLIVLFALPIFLSSLFQTLYNSVDSLIVGNVLGKESLAAVSSSGNLIFMITGFFTGTATGAGVIIARYFGSKEYDNMRKAIHTNIAFGLVASILLTIFGVFMTPYILRWMGTPEEVLPKSIKYFRVYFYGITGTVMYNTLNGILQALGNSKRPLVYLLISSLLNVALDLILVMGFKLDVDAAALATSISTIVSALLCFLFLIKRNTIYQVRIREIRFHKNMLIQILKYGIPSGIQNSVIGFANVMVQSNINSFGENAMAGCGAFSKCEGFGFLPVTCFTMAITTFVGQNLGAGEYERAKQGSRFGIATSIILAEIIGAVMYISAPQLIGLFNKDPNVVKFGVTQMRIMTPFYFLLAFAHCVAAVARGAGKAFVPMLIMFLIWCVLRVSYITIMMNYKHEIHLLFWAYPLTWGISDIFYFCYYFFTDWVHGYEKKNGKNNENYENV